ncbi:polysaccharide deacetylase family protein [Candidatus Bathycorpusculum sp.]|uniref:polysaccharide deacetylase family protein n=1 Tax=Candidatus Bathycorpusculum sp. TaxID=2994959 RepID=UPI0028365115|nr:polysaccharide deacetylase family protein [Candidatus Termitimicrobium sp.]MCL2685352.1 polysaccharide deacetylase family protein [Candidatus Termitimicrobium sp.]
MTDVAFVFEVHQPHRLRRSLFWEGKLFRRQPKEELFNYYFDTEVDREIFKRAAKKCYLPSNQIILKVIDEHKRSRKQAKFSFSVSGVFLEQCEMFDKDLLETFRQLAKSGRVEFLNQTHYHSIASLYPNKEEFVAQAQMHKQTIKDLLGYTPVIFENTELLYNNAIAKTVEDMGYRGIYTEGVERILGGKSPNYLYTPKGNKKIRVLLRNYKLTDDIGFRFSARWWSEWPLTADKYAHWLATTKGEVINIFPDYETFGEHHWPETGIHGFLQHLPDEILKQDHLKMVTPTEVVEKHASSGEIDVPEAKGSVSWADVQRDQSGWLGNVMQWAYYTVLHRLEPLVLEARDEVVLRLWRNFQTSDHLYYMFTSGGGPGEVHSYFSPYESPMDAFVAAQTLINDFEARLRQMILAANEPFLFYTDNGEKYYTGRKAWSLLGFISALGEVPVRAIEFHADKDDFERWARFSLRDNKLAENIKALKVQKGETLRKSLIATTKEHFTTQNQQVM